ncbi:MAG: hypothetical protein LBS43_00295 [Prevotellaceae bacterium]|jgi:hypothetical protein|nr:hypothetical protein [Prevotellaceae bacterium]
MKKGILFLLAIICNFAVSGQSFEQIKNELSELMTMASEEYDYAKKQEYVASFSALLQKTLKTPNSLSLQFDSIPHLRIISSQDGILRIFSFGTPKGKGEYLYYAIIQRRMGDGNSPLSDIYVMNDVKQDIFKPEAEILHYPNWYGCLYYDIIETQDVGKTYYTLLGFDFNNGISHKKYIDVLTFNPQGIPSFGAPIFFDTKGIKSRITFEYSAKSVMHLKYHADLKKIIFHWLYPIVPEKINDKSYYVPDVTYDGYTFKLGKWVKEKNVLVKKDRFQ